MRRLIPLLLFATSLAAASPATSNRQPSTDLDATVARALRTFEVPGVAIAVVKDGKVVLAKGYGVRKLGDPSPVTEKTIFGIASNTKAFTAALVAMLVDEGKLSWDDRVIDHLPNFAMYDPYVTRELRVRDLFVHNSGLGLGAGDLLWWPETTYTADELISRLRYIKPATSFRSRYAYDNVLYIAAGRLIERVTGKSWDDVIRERIFIPLGMTSTNTSMKAFRPGDEIAMPHARAEGLLESLPFADSGLLGAAGAINAPVIDVAKWMIVQLDRGAIRGTDKRLFTEKQSKEMWTPHTIMPVGEPPKALTAMKPNFATYALGWNVRDYRGTKIVTHTGGLVGMTSRTLLIPDLNLGIAVLTNQEARGGYDALTFTILDSFLGAPKTDWIAAFETLAQEAEKNEAERVKSAAESRNAKSKPSLPLERYAGTYRDPWYGDVTVAKENDRLVMRFSRTPRLTGTLEHWQYETFIVRWTERALNADAFVTFNLGPDGAVETAKMKAVSPLTDFSFDFHDLELRRVQ